MANKYRLRHGQMLLATYGVALATVIERGDMVFIDTTNNEVRPAEDVGFQSTLAATQAVFADLFVGVATEASTSADSADIGVDISAEVVYEFDATSAVYLAGASCGPSDNGNAGNAIDNQSLEAAIASSSMARVFDKEESAVTSIKVKFASIHNISANTAAAVIG